VRQIALLRGVNLGPRNRVAMPELRSLLTEAGFEDVATYLQSGNVVLSSDEPPERLATQLERLIADGLGLDIDVIVRTRDELAEVVRRNPLGDVATETKRHQVSFLSAEPDPETVRELASLAVPPEQLAAIGRELYAWYPNGMARSKMAARLAARDLGVTATARNWTTVTKLLEMADE
jgi:uncharacterized protein (DUF1697 family)